MLAFVYTRQSLRVPSDPVSRLMFTSPPPPVQLQLLGQIYRPQHYYVLHVDARADPVRHELSAALGRLANVRVLPRERSFAASWASFNIVRAELEVCWSEMLC